MKFHITTHGHLTGVRLSLEGRFGNIPFASDGLAAWKAKLIADGQAFTIERTAYPALGRNRGVLDDL